MSSFTLLDLSTIVRSWGRGVIFRAARWSPGDGPLVMTHLGDTEGDLKISTNAEMASLTLPELTGPAAHEVDYTGEAPSIEIPMFLTDPAHRALVSPTGSANAGRSRRSAPAEHTLAIFPEDIFLKPDGDGIVQAYALSLTAGIWYINAVAATAAQLALLDQTFWAWRVMFTRPPITFYGGAGDARKQIETVTAMLAHHPDMPEGHHLYTIGDPMDSSIDIETGS